MMAERRQHPRYPVRDGEFQVISHDSKIMGKLNNISQGGLAFHYSPVEGRRAESETIDIMARNSNPFFLPSVACRTMYDISTLAEDRTFTGAAARLCGMKFVRLQDDQTQKLAHFIKKYGLEPFEDIG